MNTGLKDKPESINKDPYMSWMIVLKTREPGRRVAPLLDATPVRRAHKMSEPSTLQRPAPVAPRAHSRSPTCSSPRHIGPDASDTARKCCATIGASSLDALIDEAIPARIRLPQPLDLPDGQSEQQFLRGLGDVASRNYSFRSYIGLGYYDCVTPSVIVRNVLENPGWYTPYTPYAGGGDRAGAP